MKFTVSWKGNIIQPSKLFYQALDALGAQICRRPYLFCLPLLCFSNYLQKREWRLADDVLNATNSPDSDYIKFTVNKNDSAEEKKARFYHYYELLARNQIVKRAAVDMGCVDESRVWVRYLDFDNTPTMPTHGNRVLEAFKQLQKVHPGIPNSPSLPQFGVEKAGFSVFDRQSHICLSLLSYEDDKLKNHADKAIAGQLFRPVNNHSSAPSQEQLKKEMLESDLQLYAWAGRMLTCQRYVWLDDVVQLMSLAMIMMPTVWCYNFLHSKWLFPRYNSRWLRVGGFLCLFEFFSHCCDSLPMEHVLCNQLLEMDKLQDTESAKCLGTSRYLQQYLSRAASSCESNGQHWSRHRQRLDALKKCTTPQENDSDDVPAFFQSSEYDKLIANRLKYLYKMENKT